MTCSAPKRLALGALPIGDRRQIEAELVAEAGEKPLRLLMGSGVLGRDRNQG